TLELTGRYTRPRAVDIEAATSMLPSLKPTGDRLETVAMTGTNGPIGHRQPSDSTAPASLDAGNSGPEGQPISKRFGPRVATAGDVSGGSAMLPEAMAGSDDPTSINKNPPFFQGIEASRCPEMLPDVSPDERRRRESNPLLRFCRPPHRPPGDRLKSNRR